jgi:hypothetical protein
LFNGLLYLFIMPPWQHYDEPNHFEYVWLIAARGKLPEPDDYDTSMRQAVAQSMIDHHFFSEEAVLPDITSQKPWIGAYPQLVGPPLYYLLASIPLRLLPIQDVTIQLYATRMVSLSLFLVTILVSYGLVSEITPDRHPLRYMVPITIALLPAFVDLMTAVNNDAAAIAFFSLFLWGAVRLIRRGPSLLTLLWVVFAGLLCVFTKRAVYMALPLTGIALLFAFLRGKYRKLAWGILAAGVLLGILALFSWGDARLWYRDTTQKTPTRTSLPETPVGDTAFRLLSQPGDPIPKLIQLIPPQKADLLSDKPVTMGAWIWASHPIQGQSLKLRIYDDNQHYSQKISITEKPQFFALNFTPHSNTKRAWVILEPDRKLDLSEPIEVYFDGLILAIGSYPIDQAPQINSDGISGTWGDEPFENLLRNPSANHGWMYLRPWADHIISRFFSDYEGQESFSLTIYSLADFQVTKGYYWEVILNIFRTFWAKFGWGHVPLVGSKPYAWFLLPMTILAVIGVGLGILQRRKQLRLLPWDAFFLLGLTMLIFWGLTFVRGSTYLLTKPYVPVARYTYPAIIPTVLFLNVGWLSVLGFLEKNLGVPSWAKYAIHFGLFMMLDIYALVSIIYFYE